MGGGGLFSLNQGPNITTGQESLVQVSLRKMSDMDNYALLVMFNGEGRHAVYFNERRIETLEAAGYRFFNSILPPGGRILKHGREFPRSRLLSVV